MHDFELQEFFLVPKNVHLKALLYIGYISAADHLSLGSERLNVMLHKGLSFCWFKNRQLISCWYKFFMYVTKTCLNLTKYSRKPVNYNTIIFEINIMEKSYPINLKFTFLPLSKPKWHIFSDAVSWCSQ